MSIFTQSPEYVKSAAAYLLRNDWKRSFMFGSSEDYRHHVAYYAKYNPERYLYIEKKHAENIIHSHMLTVLNLRTRV
jgi:hypothetical protein